MDGWARISTQTSAGTAAHAIGFHEANRYLYGINDNGALERIGRGGGH